MSSKLNFTAPMELLELLRSLIAQLNPIVQKELSVRPDLCDSDADLADTWEDSLKSTLVADCQHLEFLLSDPELGYGAMTVEAELAEPCLRAASALRLKIRSVLLENLGDSELESPEALPENLSVEERQAYACYLLLASLQSSLIETLDPEASNLDI